MAHLSRKRLRTAPITQTMLENLQSTTSRTLLMKRGGGNKVMCEFLGPISVSGIKAPFLKLNFHLTWAILSLECPFECFESSNCS